MAKLHTARRLQRAARLPGEAILLTLKDQNLSPALTGGRRMATTTSPRSALPLPLTKLSAVCQEGLLPGVAVWTSAPAAISSVAASDSSPRSLVRTRLPPSVAAART